MTIVDTVLTAWRLSSWPDNKLGKKLMQKILYYTIFYKNLFYWNGKAEINQNFKNVLRTFRSILLICILNDKHKIK